MSELPIGWVEAKFTDFLDIQGGTQPPKSQFSESYVDGLVRLLQIRDFSSDDKAIYIRDSNKWRKCNQEDILIARYGASLGRILTGKSGAYNVALAKVIFFEKYFDRKFIFLLLKTSYFQEPLASISRSAQNGFNKEDLDRIFLPIAPLNEQRRIVAKLDNLFARNSRAREELGRVPGLCDRYKQAVLAAAISGQLTGEWYVGANHSSTKQLISLSNVLSELKTGPFGSVLHKSDYVKGGIPIVNPMHINVGKIIPSNEMTVSPKKAEELSDFILKNGDVVIARRGIVGRCAVVQPEQEGWLCGTGSMILRPKPQLLPQYLQIFLSSPTTVETLETDAVGSTMVNLNQRGLLSLQLWLPTLLEQQEIIQRIEKLFKAIDLIEQEYQKASKLCDRLEQATLAKAFRGELVPQDPNDEPASVLLKRIRAEKQDQPKRKAVKSKQKSG